MRTARRKPRRQHETAAERITILFGLAEREFRRRPDRSRRYAGLAAKIAMRYNVRLPRNLKRRFCKECHTYLVPGLSCRTRTSRGRRIVTCLHCGRRSRHPVTKGGLK